MTINIPVPPLDFNAGGGCGAPDCDYQVQCWQCFEVSRSQLAEFWARHGCKKPVMIGLFNEGEMRDADHAEALASGR